MSAAAQKQALFGTSQADRDASNAYWRKVWGDRILNSSAAGLGLGMGGTGLYYLYKGLTERQNAPLVEDTDEEVTTDAEAFAPEKKRKKAASLADRVGGMLPTSWLDLVSNLGSQGAGPRDINTTRTAFGNTALVGGAGLGLLGGHYLMKNLYQKKKKQDLEEEIADAAKEYHSALMSKKIKKATTTEPGFFRSALDTTWDAATQLPGVGPMIEGMGHSISTPYVMTGAGLGALSMYLMYERARGLSRARAAEAAEKSKARLAGAASDYVDPEELAAIKRMA